VSRLAAWWQRWQDTTALDVVTALVLTVVLTLGAYGEAHPEQVSDQVLNGTRAAHTPPAAYLLVIAACLVLAARRRWPLPVLCVSVAAVAAYSLLGYVNGSVLLAPVIALYRVARASSPRRALLAGAATLVALAAATAANSPFGPTGGGFYLIPALVAAVVFPGIAVRARQEYLAQRARDEARRRVDEERLRIARELHDVVAHTMATIAVQAGMAAHVLERQPEVAAQALATIRQASKEGLGELRAILNVLRQADEGDPAMPAPGLAQLDALVAGARRAGLPVTVRQPGGPRELPAPADLTAYRIVQESLTNVIRHAGPAAATVEIRYRDDAVEIEVTDTGRGAPADDGAKGHGLAGMRERAAALGGTVTAGPGAAGGFRVSARLPCIPRPQPPEAARDTPPPEGAQETARAGGPA
jgi:signal transduction histidine kinase